MGGHRRVSQRSLSCPEIPEGPNSLILRFYIAGSLRLNRSAGQSLTLHPNSQQALPDLPPPCSPHLPPTSFSLIPPAILASSLLPRHPKLVPASGPLCLLLPLSRMPLPSGELLSHPAPLMLQIWVQMLPPQEGPSRLPASSFSRTAQGDRQTGARLLRCKFQFLPRDLQHAI